MSPRPVRSAAVPALPCRRPAVGRQAAKTDAPRASGRQSRHRAAAGHSIRAGAVRREYKASDRDSGRRVTPWTSFQSGLPVSGSPPSPHSPACCEYRLSTPGLTDYRHPPAGSAAPPPTAGGNNRQPPASASCPR
ncbi:hypothetical protein BLA29_000013 [Euroglyphus maynei]|uniref:Uncharacterized protein n=1 Tax=Euroglyphus maynei TaxID=6958 RepID=A0A1Y3AVI1_EURMA|nr:hypothetical protein BLA29_000013 [Euroglyphus maynei]